jgi:GNAT superfamily N-acetyltransferase
VNPDIQVRPAQGPKDLERFIEFQYELHRDLPHWVPPLRVERREFLDPGKNPLFEYAQVQCFLATRGGKVAGTIAAVRNERYGQFHPEEAHVGFFGLFECVDDPGVAGALFGAALEWLGAQGYTVARGPVNLTTNDVLGLLVDGFDDDNTLMMPYNPPYYANLFEGAEFRKAKDLFAYYLDATQYGGRLDAVADHLMRGGHIKLRRVDLKNLRTELEFIRSAYNQAWARNWGFVPWTDRELDYIAKELKPLVDPPLALVAEHDGVPAGMIVSIPDANEAIKPTHGDLFPLGILKVLWRLKVRRCRRLRTIMMGVLPEVRRKGLDLLMIQRTIQEGQRLGYHGSELSWILEDNEALLSPLRQMGCQHTKTYRVYDKDI